MSIKIINQLNKYHTGSVIFFHGSGDTGQGIIEWIQFLVKDFSAPHIRFLFPTAPKRKYTPLGGELSNVWFDRYDINPEVAEHDESLESMGVKVKEIIAAEISTGVPIDRIIVGGFSMGGALAMHTAYRWAPDIAGVFALSSFLNKNSKVYEEIGPEKNRAPIFMCHGEKDTLVPLQWGKDTFNNLKKFEVAGQFHTIPNTLHEIKKNEINKLLEWIKETLPP